MSFLVVFVFLLPLVVGLAVVAVKVLEFALNRDIASAKKVAKYTTVFTIVAIAIAGVVLVIYLSAVMGGDSS